MYVDALHTYMSRWHQAGRFEGTVTVMQRGRVLLSAGYGYANREHRVPHSPASRFQVGSITKSFVAAAILQLAEQGRLRLDDPLARFLPDYKAAGSITMHHLLSNTSGIPDHTRFAEYTVRESLTPATILARLNERELDFQPGAKLDYSNSNYVLLAVVVEAVSGLSVEEYLERNLTGPAGLTSTGVSTPGRVIENLASGYSHSGEGVVQADLYDISGAFGSGFLHATGDDLTTWIERLVSEKVVAPASYEQMITPYGSIPHMQASWGYGCYLRPDSFFMIGFISGYNCQVTRFLDRDLTLVLLSNNDTSPLHRIERGLVKIIATGNLPDDAITPPPLLDVNPEWLWGIAGSYMSPFTGGRFTITYENGRFFADRLFAQTCRQRRYGLNLVAHSENSCTFAVEICDGTFSFIRDEDGHFSRAAYTWDTFSIPYVREDA